MSDNQLTATIGQTPEGNFIQLPDAMISTKPTARTTTVEAPELGNRDLDVERWGKTNRHPTLVRQKLELNSMAGQAIERRVRMLYGNGLYYYKNSDIQDGDNEVKRHYDPEIEAWLRVNRIRQDWYPNQCIDYVTFNNTFSELVLSLDKSKVTGLYHKPAEHCRLSAQDEQGRFRFVLYSKHWVLGTAREEDRVPLRLYQWDIPDVFFATQRSFKYAWHTKGPGLGIVSYANPPHQGLFKENGWLDVSSNVPGIVHTMQTNQVSIKYQIVFDEEYFAIRNPGWKGFGVKKRDEIFQKKVGEITASLSGTDNILKTIATIVRNDRLSGNERGGIQIIAIDDKVKKDAWVPDAEQANMHIVQGLGNDPSLVGLQPAGGKMGAGSGSDKRESYNVGITLNTLDQDIILEPLQHAADRNGWDVKFMISHTAHTTLNQNKTGKSSDTLAVDPV